MAQSAFDEKNSRMYSVGSAVGTHILEDLPPDAKTMAILRGYERGELSLEQFSAAMDAHARELVQSTSLISA